jgi:PleD family two-component response regulator
MADDDTELSLFERADKALYQAKRGGRDRLCVSVS